MDFAHNRPALGRRTAIALVAVSLLAVMALASPPGADARGVKRCSPPRDYIGAVLGLKVRNGSCRSARNVARAWYERGTCGGGTGLPEPTCKALGYSCRNRNVAPSGEGFFKYRVRCTKGRKAVAFRLPVNQV